MYKVVINRTDAEETKEFENHADALQYFFSVSGCQAIRQGIKKTALYAGEVSLGTWEVLGF